MSPSTISAPVTKKVHHWRLTVAYLILVAGIVFAVDRSHENQLRIERQAQVATTINCEDNNKTIDIVHQVVLVLLGEPEGPDDPDYARRLTLYRQIEPLLEPNDCPPIPE